MEGGFCLNGSSIQNGEVAGHLDTDIEECISIYDIPFNSESITTRWGKKSVLNFFIKDLNQRDKGTTAKINHYIEIESVDDYETNSGVMAKITNKTSLIPFQAPICGNLDTFVTIANIYMVTNEFKDIESRNVKFRFNLQGSKGIHFRYFKDPVIYEDKDDMITKISEQFSDISYKGTDIPYRSDTDAYVSIPVPASGKSVYALAGLVVSENGKKTNALVINLESAGTTPAGWLTSMRYATGVNSTENAYTYEEILDGQRTSYTESNIYTDNNDYIVTSETQNTESFGELTYPVYTMKKDMWHSTDGAFISASSSSNAITKTPQLFTSFAAKNVDNYVVYVNEENSSYTWFLNGSMPSDITTASDNGIETVKYFGNSSEVKIGNSGSLKRLKDGTTDTADSNYPKFTNGYWTNMLEINPLKSKGEKTITVGTKGVSGELIILFKVIINKQASPENYIKDTVFGRRDNLSSNESTVVTEHVDILPTYFQKGFSDYYSDNNISTLASMGTALDNQFSDFVSNGNTYYPTTITSSINVTAENGAIQKYSYVHKFNEIEMLPIDYLYNSYNSNLSTYGDEHLLFLDKQTMSYNNTIYFSAKYKSNYGITLHSSDFLLFRVEVYIDGVLDKALGLSDLRNRNWHGLRFALGAFNNLIVSMDDGFTINDIPEGVITIKPIIRLNKNGNYRYNRDLFTLELQSFSISKTYLKDHRIISALWDNAIVTSAISTMENELSENVDIFGDGTIDYSLTPDDVNTFYITNSVKPDCANNTLSIAMPPFSKLQEFNGSSWVTVYSAGASSVYQKVFNYSFSELQSGYHYNFRVVAQSYDEDNDEMRNLVSYYYTTITAATRNKDISIEFDSGSETMQLYSEIISNNGNAAISINGKNGTTTVMQQTKFYNGISASDLESTYYKLSQGDYAIDVQVPHGYKYKIKITGGSSEGYLIDHKSVKGKRLLLPYANAQNIRLIVYLERDTESSSWGVTFDKTLFSSTRSNKI